MNTEMAPTMHELIEALAWRYMEPLDPTSKAKYFSIVQRIHARRGISFLTWSLQIACTYLKLHHAKTTKEILENPGNYSLPSDKL